MTDVTHYAIARHGSLLDNWQTSRVAIAALRQALASAPLGAAIRTIAAAGSLGRMEASGQSDADLIVVVQDGVDEGARKDAHAAVLHVLDGLNVPRPKARGVFGEPCSLADICGERVGHGEEPLNVFGKRLLLLLETQPVYGDGDYDQVIKTLIARYASGYVDKDPRKEWTFHEAVLTLRS